MGVSRAGAADARKVAHAHESVRRASRLHAVPVVSDYIGDELYRGLPVASACGRAGRRASGIFEAEGPGVRVVVGGVLI